MCKTIGILGGMGPYATIDLFQKIVVNTPARTDQEHHRIIIYNNPKIPPRILASIPYPLPELIKSAVILERAGADFIIMPCNTAHLWLDDIKKAISIPLYSMIENTVQAMLQLQYIGKKIVLLATETTIQHELYQHAFSKSPFEIVTPNQEEQNVVNTAIEYVKAGSLATNPCLETLNLILMKYREKGIKTLIGGCSEIPLLFPYFIVEMGMIDPTLLLAKMAIIKAT